MTKYLLRRRNRHGQWVHLATTDFNPSNKDVEKMFGPGDYTVLRAEEGVIGLAKEKDVSVPWSIEMLDWIEGEPTREYLMKKYGAGNYFVLKSCQPVPHTIFPEGKPHDVTWQLLQDGASVMKNISIIFRVQMPWV